MAKKQTFCRKPSLKASDLFEHRREQDLLKSSLMVRRLVRATGMSAALALVLVEQNGFDLEGGARD